MAIEYRFAVADTYFGVTYAAGDLIDTTGWGPEDIRRLLSHAPVYVVDTSLGGGGSGFTARGAWAPTTAYAVDDVYTHAGSTYHVTTGYTSGGSFGATDTANTEVWAAAGTNGTNGADGATGAPGAGMATFSQSGVVTTATGDQRWYNDTGGPLTIGTIRASVGTQPATGPVTVDVNINGTTIFTTQANRPSVTTGTNTDTGTPDVTTLAAGDYLTVDRDAADGTAADLVVQIPLSS